MAWYLLRAATRQEAKAIQSLKELGLYAYCPMRTTWDRLSKVRGKTKTLALFPGYIFAQIPEERGLYGIREADGVHAFVLTSSHSGERVPAVVSACDVEGLIAAQEVGAFDETKPKPKWNPKAGERVKVSGGPFTGFVGRVIEAQGEKRVRVLLDSFKNAAPLRLKTDQVERAA